MSAVDFQKEHSSLAASDAGYQTKLHAIVRRDTLYQERVAERGGTMTTTLTDHAEAAAAAVTRQRDAARAKLARPVVEAAKAEHERLVRTATASASAFLADRAALAAFEDAQHRYLAAAGQPMRQPMIAGEDANAAALLDRAQRLLNPPTSSRPAVNRQPLAQPDYADLVAS